MCFILNVVSHRTCQNGNVECVFFFAASLMQHTALFCLMCHVKYNIKFLFHSVFRQCRCALSSIIILFYFRCVSFHCRFSLYLFFLVSFFSDIKKRKDGWIGIGNEIKKLFVQHAYNRGKLFYICLG